MASGVGWSLPSARGGLIGGGRLLELLTLEGEFAEDTLAFRIHNHALTAFPGLLEMACRATRAQRTAPSSGSTASRSLAASVSSSDIATAEQAVVEHRQIHDLRLGELLEDDDASQTVQELRAELLFTPS